MVVSGKIINCDQSQCCVILLNIQTDEVLSKDSAEELNSGSHPGPMTEIEFWRDKCRNLESLFDQMKTDTTNQMASILELTDSAYYPSFQNMMSKVVASLREALDITCYLEPLSEQFEVINHAVILDIHTVLAAAAKHRFC